VKIDSIDEKLGVHAAFEAEEREKTRTRELDRFMTSQTLEHFSRSAFSFLLTSKHIVPCDQVLIETDRVYFEVVYTSARRLFDICVHVTVA
jgi:hypothetical protein